MTYLRAFAPWIAFALVSGAGWRWSALTGLLVTLGLLVLARRAGVTSAALVLEISSAVFFVALTALAFAEPDAAARHYAGALALGWLALVAGGSLAARRPFTLGIARQSTPREFWDHPAFLRVNTVITTVWAVSFAVTAVVLAVLAAASADGLALALVQVAGFVAPAVFTARYSALARARVA